MPFTKNVREVTKNVTEVAKKCSRMKMVLKVTKSLLYLFLSHFTAMFCLLHLRMVFLYGLIVMILHGHTALKLKMDF